MMAGMHVTWATFGLADERPMGMGNYEREVQAALERTAQPGWSFSRRIVTPVRTSREGGRRIPFGALERGSSALASCLGRIAYRGDTNVHRFDLRLPPARGSEVVTVHDVAPLRFADEGVLPAWSAASARAARLVICPSAFAAEEVSEVLGVANIVVVHNGVAPAFGAATALSATERDRLGLPERYVLTAAGASRRKNLPLLAEAWKLVEQRVPGMRLVLSGADHPARRRVFGGLPSVASTGYLGAEDMPGVVASAAAVVVPSLYEGFGLPALEAMAAGVPVVAVRAGALPEVCGDAGVLVPDDGEAMADAIVDLCLDGERAGELSVRGRARAASFTWEASAAGHLEAYSRAFGEFTPK